MEEDLFTLLLRWKFTDVWEWSLRPAPPAMCHNRHKMFSCFSTTFSFHSSTWHGHNNNKIIYREGCYYHVIAPCILVLLVFGWSEFPYYLNTHNLPTHFYRRKWKFGGWGVRSVLAVPFWNCQCAFGMQLKRLARTSNHKSSITAAAY